MQVARQCCFERHGAEVHVGIIDIEWAVLQGWHVHGQAKGGLIDVHPAAKERVYLGAISVRSDRLDIAEDIGRTIDSRIGLLIHSNRC
jgi:hypothetical protein